MGNSPDFANVHDLRGALRRDLVAAMKARQPEVVAVLRTTIAALDNAEAVEAPDGDVTVSSAHVAGARPGAGSTEAARRTLSVDDVRGILAEQVAERLAGAEEYDALEQPDTAARLRREADALRAYLA